MDVIISGRHHNVSDQFREHVNGRMSRIEQLAPRALRVEVVLSAEPGRGRTKANEKVEITCRARGPVIRAEASHEDKYAAFEMAVDKLVERLRRANDRRRVTRGTKPAEPATLPESAPVAPPEPEGEGEPDLFGAFGDSPVEVREKVHQSAPMTLPDAMAEMELVGHDFYLFHDSETGKPSVVYKRHGWKYGVIHLEVDAADATSGGEQSAGRVAAS